MDKNECITCLKILRDNCKTFYEISANKKIEALNMAIRFIEQEPKTGYWIEHPHEAGANWEFSRYECSECHEWSDDDSDYCHNCGVKMVELQESEG